MVLYEILLYILGFSLLLSFFVKKEMRRIDQILCIVLGAILIILNIFISSFRWYFIILYIAYIPITFLIVYRLIKKTSLKKVAIATIVIMLISLVFSMLLVTPDMPELTNDSLIGTKTYEITDESRIEQYDESNDYRRFKIQVWYPASNVDGLEKAKWLYEGEQVVEGLCENNNLPSYFLNHLTEVESNSYIDAQILDSTSKYPVVVISHGWSGFKTLHTDLAEELASNGFFVISIDHTYGSVATIFDDGTLALNYRDALPDYEDPGFLMSANTLVNTYAGDISATLDYLSTLNMYFNHNINIQEIGLLGHSTGGGADVTVALQDSRVKALFGLDAWVAPISDELIDTSLNIPAMFLRSEAWEDVDNNDNLYEVVNNNEIYSTLYQIDGTTHIDFTMTHMFASNTRLLGLTGKLKQDYLNHILEISILDFFESTLVNRSVPNPNIFEDEGIEEVSRISTY